MSAAPSEVQLSVQTAPHQLYTVASSPLNYEDDDARIDIKDAGFQATMTVHSAHPMRHECTSPTPGQQAANPQNAYLQAQLKSGFSVATFEFNDPSSLTAYFISSGVAKAHSSVLKRFVSGMLAGCFVVFGCVFALVAAGGLDPAFRAAYPAVPKLITGATFPVCLLMIMLVGGDLFTGNCMYMAMGLFTGRVGFGQCANVLITSFVSNFMGLLLFDFFLVYRTELLLAEPYHSWMLSVAASKIKLDFGVAVLRGVGANAMVCVAVFMGCSARDALGRFVLAYWPITLFAVVGFEHVIANMAFIPIALMYGAPFSVHDYIVRSCIPACIGNIIGGSFLVGGFCAYLYGKPCQSSFREWLHYVCVPDVSIGVWFKELYHQLLSDRPIKDPSAPVKTLK